jgi:hypothetical protein
MNSKCNTAVAAAAAAAGGKTWKSGMKQQHPPHLL